MNAKILNVDDREVGRYIRTQILRQAGFTVIEASTGAEALSRFETDEPHLVLLDINLPDLSGLEVCRRMKETRPTQSVIVLHISATQIDAEAQKRGLEGGADGYLTEPVEPELLVAHIRSLLRLRRVEEELRESEERFRSVFNEAPIGILLIEPDLRVRHANASAALMLAQPEAALIGSSIAELLHPVSAQNDLQQLRRVLQGVISRYQAETEFLRGAGDSLSANLMVSLVRDAKGQPRHAIALLEDISQRKRAEEALLRSNEELNAFAYAASHDLQEPLRTIASYTQLLARRYQGRLDHDADELIEYVVAGTLRLQSLIRDLLAFSQMQTPAEEQHSLVDMASVLAQATNGLGTAIQETGTVVTVGEMPTVLADAAPLVQLFQNLLGNAIKYRRPGVPPAIHISAERTDPVWLFAVRDNGMGFSPEYANRIFGIFKRLHGREIPGTGIGLALCKKIIERFGGRIWAESQPGEGSTFYFTLPVIPEELTPSGVPASS